MVAKNEAEKGAIDPEIGNISRSEYESYKKRALDFEAKNRRFIVVVPCSGRAGWCEIPDNSALLYKYAVCEPIGVEATIAGDYDSFYSQYRIGKCKTRGFEAVRRRIKDAGLFMDEQKKGKCLIVCLNKTFTKQEIDKFEAKEILHRATANKIVDAKPVDPVLYQKILQLATRLHKVCNRRMDRLTSETNGKRMVMLMDAMMREYVVRSTGEAMTKEEELKMWNKLRGDARAILIELQIVAGMGLWKANDCLSIGGELTEIIERIDKKCSR